MTQTESTLLQILKTSMKDIIDTSVSAVVSTCRMTFITASFFCFT